MSQTDLLIGPQTWTGAILIDKPEGITSAHVLDRFKRVWRTRYGWKSRELPTIGHGGTLDPFATGVLVVLLGSSTRLSQYLLGSDKTYQATIQFGVQTSTGDLTGEVTRSAPVPSSFSALQSTSQTFLGSDYWQVPPMVSAKKRDGVALYTLARQGIEIERAPIRCQVKSIEVQPSATSHSLDGSPPEVHTAQLTACVSGGTYIRTLAEDLASRAGSLAHLTQLRRTASGPFSLDRAISAEAFEGYLREAPDHREDLERQSFWISPYALTWKLPHLTIDEVTAKRIRRGEQEALLRLHEPLNEFQAHSEVVLSLDNELIAIVRHDPALSGVWKYARVFPERTSR